MRAILLAAGHSEITTGPISNIEIRGIRLLDLQVSFLRNAGAEQIILVAGHASEKVSRADIEIRKNHFWMGNGSISSLETVSDLLDGADDILIAYGDTLFDVSVINKLTKSSAPVSIIGLSGKNPSDSSNYREYGRTSPFLRLLEITAQRHNEDNQFIFTGLVFVRRGAAKSFGTCISKASADRTAHVGAALNELIAMGAPVTVLPIQDGWVEFNTMSKFESMMQSSLLINQVVQIHVNWIDRLKGYEKIDWVNNDDLISNIVDVAREAKNDRIIDLGTGTGKVLLAARQSLNSQEAWGVDLCQASLEKIPNHTGLILMREDIESLANIPDDYFDLATARMVFHHINDTSRAMDNIFRILNKGGLFVICEGSPPTIRTIKWYTEMFRYKEDRKTLTEVDLINLLLRAGFEKVQTRSIVMRNCSLNNWLDNSGIPDQNIQILKEMHHNAPSYVKDDYEMKFENGDCLMTWRFAITYGRKPLK